MCHIILSNKINMIAKDFFLTVKTKSKLLYVYKLIINNRVIVLKIQTRGKILCQKLKWQLLISNIFNVIYYFLVLLNKS